MPPSFDLVSYSVSGNFLEVSAWSSGGGLGQFSHICGPDRTELALSAYLQINLQVSQTNIPQSCQGTEGKCTELFKGQLHGPVEHRLMQSSIRTEKWARQMRLKYLQ